MNKITIPSLLLGIVMIAGIFAFMPVYEASTVHTTIQATTVRLVEAVQDELAATPVDDDFTITCPAASDGCQIIEVYIHKIDSLVLQIDEIDATINGELINQIAEFADITIGNDSMVVIASAGGIGLGAGDSLTIVTNNGASSSVDYQMRVIALVEGSGTIETGMIP